MALWRLYYHLVWSTKERTPLITSDIESHLYGYIIGKAHALSCITHAIGGMEDHIHNVVSIPPKLAVSEYVQNIKGSSAHFINHGNFNLPTVFAWQRGYGIFSLGAKQLDRAVDYVLNQKAHHLDGTVTIALEEVSEEDVGPTVWNHGKALSGISVLGNRLKINFQAHS